MAFPELEHVPMIVTADVIGVAPARVCVALAVMVATPSSNCLKAPTTALKTFS
jgi:hypothetical protein